VTQTTQHTVPNDRAVDEVLGRGEVRTADLGGGSTTHEMAEALADEVIRANAAS